MYGKKELCNCKLAEVVLLVWKVDDFYTLIDLYEVDHETLYMASM